MGNDRDRNDHGRYNDRIDPETVLDLFDARDDRARPLTASDVVDELGIARRTAHNKLNALVERGVLETRKVGARGRVWWTPIPTDERRREHAETPIDDGGGETTDSAGTPATSTGGRTGEAMHDSGVSGDVAVALEHVAEDVLPGSGEKLEERREALYAAVEYLRERGTATPSDFQTEVYPDHPARYTEGKDPARSWWKNCIYKGLGEVAERTDAVEKPDQTGVWTWHGNVDDLEA